jgi:hypothetical protein
MYAGYAALICAAPRLVLSVFNISSWSQIIPPVVVFYAINMVYLRGGPFAHNIQPHQTMRHIPAPVNFNVSVAFCGEGTG